MQTYLSVVMLLSVPGSVDITVNFSMFIRPMKIAWRPGRWQTTDTANKYLPKFWVVQSLEIVFAINETNKFTRFDF